MIDERTGLDIDYSVNDTFSEFAKATFETTLSREGETPMDSHARAARAWCGEDIELANRLLHAAAKKWFMWASPVIMNAPLPGEKLRHMPISCFLLTLDDSIVGLRDNLVETINLTTVGGGVGAHWSNIRSADNKSRGIIPHQKILDAVMGGYAQARGRRGSVCVHVDIDHPDVPEFINIRIPTQGDPARKCLGTGYHHCVNITDAFMRAVDEDKDWSFIDPHTKKVVSTFKARDVWRALLDARMRQGEPYLFFIDTAMKYLPDAQKKLGLKLSGSNLCVSADTLLHTRDGNIAISKLEGAEVEVWNGQQYSKTVVQKTGEGQKLFRVTLSNGRTLDVTAYHKWYVYQNEEVVCLRTRDLNSSGELILEEWEDPETGETVIVAVDSVRELPDVHDTYCVNEPLRHKAMFNGIVTGNCNEITLVVDAYRTAVCCLSSLNLELIDEWWDTSLVEDILTFLDNVLTYFIENAPAGFEKAVYSAMRERAVGMGAMGFHALLQKLNVPFESKKAREINKKIFRGLRKRADALSLKLGAERGEAPDMAGTGHRFSHKMAIAPNATSSNALGTSPGIEPWAANIFNQNVTAGSFTIKNRQLERVLREKGCDTPQVWESIVTKKGSVQHLECLTDHEKAVFKTARELDQRAIIDLAADRVPEVCQSQSVNLFVKPDSNPSYISDLHMMAWRRGLKGLYYLRSEKVRTASVAGEMTRAILPNVDHEVVKDTGILVDGGAGVVVEESSCLACEG